jgi:hypothetical protein
MVLTVTIECRDQNMPRRALLAIRATALNDFDRNRIVRAVFPPIAPAPVRQIQTVTVDSRTRRGRRVGPLS